MKEIFSEAILPSGKKAIFYQGYGVHFFKSLSASTAGIIKNLIIQLVEIEGLSTTEKELDEMNIADVSYLCEVIGVMISKLDFFK